MRTISFPTRPPMVHLCYFRKSMMVPHRLQGFEQGHNQEQVPNPLDCLLVRSVGGRKVLF